MHTTAVIQARYDSSRLPGKVLAQIDHHSMLHRVIERVKRARTVDHVILATTTNDSESPLIETANKLGIDTYQGSLYDVLDRFEQAVQLRPETSTVVRVTADCPFVDPDIIDLAVATLHEGNYDYVANSLPAPWERTYPYGLDVEAFTRVALTEAAQEATETHQREHVTPFIYQHPERYRIGLLTLPENKTHHRWTVDTPEDLEAAREIAKLCPPEPYGWETIEHILLENPWIQEINSSIEHKHFKQTDHRW